MTSSLVVIGSLLATLVFQVPGQVVHDMMWYMTIARGITGVGVGGEYPPSAAAALEGSNEVSVSFPLPIQVMDFDIDVRITALRSPTRPHPSPRLHPHGNLRSSHLHGNLPNHPLRHVQQSQNSFPRHLRHFNLPPSVRGSPPLQHARRHPLPPQQFPQPIHPSLFTRVETLWLALARNQFCIFRLRFHQFPEFHHEFGDYQ